MLTATSIIEGASAQTSIPGSSSRNFRGSSLSRSSSGIITSNGINRIRHLVFT